MLKIIFFSFKIDSTNVGWNIKILRLFYSGTIFEKFYLSNLKIFLRLNCFLKAFDFFFRLCAEVTFKIVPVSTTYALEVITISAVFKYILFTARTFSLTSGQIARSEHHNFWVLFTHLLLWTIYQIYKKINETVHDSNILPIS